MRFHEKTLANGLQVIGEIAPSVHSTAIGFFVNTGSRDETVEINGVSHFLEHMVFKGTDRYSPADVNRILDEVGADYNAETGEETTLFYAAVLPEYLPRAFELLASILQPSLRGEDFDMEKKVIIEEIGMYDDQPFFVAYDGCMRNHFAGHPLGNSIIGSVESVQALTIEQMRAYHRRRYTAGNIVLAAAGTFDWKEFLSLAERHCEGFPPGAGSRSIESAKQGGGRLLLPRDSGVQEHVVQLCRAPDVHDPLRYAAALLSVVLGDDRGSRFFWEIVAPGHAEACELTYNSYEGEGVFQTYVCCSPDDYAPNVGRVRDLFDEINANGVTEDELQLAKSKVASRIVLRSERPMGRLSSLGHNWVSCREYRTVADDLAAFRSVTTADVRTLLEKFPLQQTTSVGVGPLTDGA